MTPAELKGLATNLATEQLEGFEFLGVAEAADEWEINLTDEEMGTVHHLVTTAKVVIG